MYWNLTDKDRLIKALNLADNPELMEKFLKDLLTEKEFEVCVERLKAACLLNDGVSYKQIEKITGLSSATIARLSKKYVDTEGGFQIILKKFTKKGKTYFD